MENAEKNKTEKSTLYLVGTPIGNLADISERAKKVLSEVDFIAAEDTRNTMRLCSALGIKKELVSYFEHNKKASGEKICARILAGESCALVTDAGMPAISDPGEDIVRLCAEYGIAVSVIPGPCAAVAALAMSALPTSRFSFEGFLSAQKSERKKQLSSLLREERTMIFYEAPHKLKSALTDMKDTFGENRRIALCRELTKINEEVIRTTLGNAINIYEEKEPRGEYVLILDGASKDELADGECSELLKLTPKEHVEHYVKLGMSKMDATKAAAKDRKIPKSEMYKLTLD
ncbi:MAG: 16S rRNA (cytidine(1402)-2'-O)-methyltransferase [Ruminococcaceae bacterium]|nr:16S rRNA (cytidine(1402)-2'-O)-methyltransferase [Oscillospiraceae bacterium]